VEGKLKQIAEEQEITIRPGFWDDPKKAELLMRAIQEKKTWTDDFAKARAAFDDMMVMNEFLAAGDATEEDLEKTIHHSPQADRGPGIPAHAQR